VLIPLTYVDPDVSSRTFSQSASVAFNKHNEQEIKIETENELLQLAKSAKIVKKCGIC
jgi:hypothetical protein